MENIIKCCLINIRHFEKCSVFVKKLTIYFSQLIIPKVENIENY